MLKGVKGLLHDPTDEEVLFFLFFFLVFFFVFFFFLFLFLFLFFFSFLLSRSSVFSLLA